MFGIEDYAGFVTAILMFQIIPGPGTVAILNATARRGVRCGFQAVLGTLCGDFVFMTAAVAGLAAALRANPLVFDTLRYAGAAYLCWIGVSLLLKRRRVHAPAASPQDSALARQAFAVSITNPKVILFFVAFFPLFLRPGSGLLTLVIMMVHVTVISALYQSALVLMGDSAARRLRGVPFISSFAEKIAGVALLGFGLRVALGER